MTRFWAKVNKNGPIPAHCPRIGKCWIWTGAKMGGGYGKVRLSNPRRLVPAHRYSFYLKHGRWPDHRGCHRCDNPACVRPSHIFDGTDKQNTQDCIRKGRFNFKARFRGESHPSAKLTAKQVSAAIQRHSAGELIKDIANDFKVTAGTVSHIINGRSWKCLARR